jgi:hypothetical protein
MSLPCLHLIPALPIKSTNFPDEPKIFTYTNSGGSTNWVWSPSEPVFAPGQGFILTTTNVNNVWVQSSNPCYGY